MLRDDGAVLTQLRRPVVDCSFIFGAAVGIGQECLRRPGRSEVIGDFLSLDPASPGNSRDRLRRTRPLLFLRWRHRKTRRKSRFPDAQTLSPGCSGLAYSFAIKDSRAREKRRLWFFCSEETMRPDCERAGMQLKAIKHKAKLISHAFKYETSTTVHLKRIIVFSGKRSQFLKTRSCFSEND